MIVGARAAVTVTVAFAVELEQLFVTVNDRFAVVPAAVCGAVKFGLATVALSKVPTSVVHEYVNGPVPAVVLPLRATVPPDPTV